MGEKSFLIDTTKCIGCASCSLVCKSINNLAASSFSYKESPVLTSEDWIIPSERRGGENTGGKSFITYLCYHCTDAECIKVCPSGAIKRKNDFVVIDAEKCIACGSCAKVCPYNAVHLGTDRKAKKVAAKKCDACIGSFDNRPQCVTVCPTLAVKFDYRLKLIKEANRRIAVLNRKGGGFSVYGLREYKGLNVLTISSSSGNPAAVNVLARSHVSRLQERSELFKVINFFVPSFKAGQRYLYRLLKSIT